MASWRMLSESGLERDQRCLRARQVSEVAIVAGLAYMADQRQELWFGPSLQAG